MKSGKVFLLFTLCVVRLVLQAQHPSSEANDTVESMNPSAFVERNKGVKRMLSDTLVIQNAFVKRSFQFDKVKPGFATREFINTKSGENYVREGTQEFSITINGVEQNGMNARYTAHSFTRDGVKQKLSVTLQSTIPNIDIVLEYIVYDSIPMVRKCLRVINRSNVEVSLINLDVEHLRFQVVNTYMNEVYANYGTNLTRIPYKGDYNDAAILLYNPTVHQGALFGNESPSVLKRTELYTQPGEIVQGMTRIDDPFPFKKWLNPNETFSSPYTFIYLSSTSVWQEFFEERYQDFVREKLGVKLFQQKNAPFFIYNTWQPFFDNINEKLIKECVDNLKDTGTDLFIIDAGWYKRAGDFNADPAKFPNGMKPVCDYIRKNNMRVGVWFTISGVHNKSEVATAHPDWLIKDKKGLTANLHDDNYETDGSNWNSAMRTMSLGSPYYNHIKETIRGYVNDWGISYLKLDLSVAHSAYVHDLERTGDYETNSVKLYKDRASSYWILYERTLALMDELHAEFPDLLLDCTFEVWGRYNSIDYALIQHADYEWLTNFDFPAPEGPLAIRQMNYDRSRVVPANTLLIGNQFMDSPHYKYVYFSMASASTLMVGDPRKLSVAAKAFYKKWNSWFKEMERKYQFSQFRQTYDVFDRPTNSNWDGCYRINTIKEGGVMFFYRNNSPDQERTFRVPCVNPHAYYKIYSHDEERVLATYKGSDLMEHGIKINIPTIFTAKVLSIEKAPGGVKSSQNED